TVDEDVLGREVRDELGDGRVDHRGRHHEPDGPGRVQLLDELRERRGALRFGMCQLVDRLLKLVVSDDVVPAGKQAERHVGAHPTESDDSELHDQLLWGTDWSSLIALTCWRPRRCAGWTHPAARCIRSQTAAP